MVKTKMVKYKLVMVIATILLATLAVPLVSAEPIKKSEREQNRLQAIQEDYNIKAEKIKKLVDKLSVDNIQSLHELFMTIWGIISLLIGHNVVSLMLARLCCCWFIFPLVVADNFVGVNTSGVSFSTYFEDCLKYFNITDILYNFGALGIIFLPVIYCWAFGMAIVCVIQNMYFQGGIVLRVQEDLDYIYTPDMLLENYSNNNNIPGFKGYMDDFDMTQYFYNTGLAGSTLSVPFTILCYLDYKNKLTS